MPYTATGFIPRTNINFAYRKHCVICTRVLLLATLLSQAGCVLVGGPSDDRPQPDQRRDWSTTQFASPATQATKNVPVRSDVAVGVTTAPIERILQSTRALLEPKAGTLKYVKRDICNGRTNHLLLAPRYNFSNKDRDYQWLEVMVNFDPATNRSLIEVHTVVWSKNTVLKSPHGGIWFFPPGTATQYTDEDDYRLLRAILDSLHDPNAHITEWGLLTD